MSREDNPFAPGNNPIKHLSDLEKQKEPKASEASKSVVLSKGQNGLHCSAGLFHTLSPALPPSSLLSNRGQNGVGYFNSCS